MIWTFELWTTGRLNSAGLELDAWTLDALTLELRMTGHLSSWHLESGRLNTWTLNPWTLDPWTLEFFSIFSDICFFFILFNAEFFNILKALGPMYYGSVERVAYGCYNSNLLQLILSIKLPSETTTWSQTQLLMQRSSNNWLGNHSNRWWNFSKIEGKFSE